MTGHLGIYRRLARIAGCGAIVVLAASLAPPVSAEMRIKLKDGRVLTVPVEREQVDSIDFGGSKPPSPGSPAQQPIERAADQIRNDGKSIRSAQEAEARAREAADRAAAAAKRAAEAAAVAKREADAAAAARKAAEGTARTSGKQAVPSRSPAKQSSLKKKPAKRAPKILKVGPGEKYSLPSQAAKAARDGDIVEIATGVYKGDVAEWYANNLTIRGVGGRAHLDAQGKSMGGKAIWVIAGNNTVVENIEFSNCRVPDNNGAGIRLSGRNLTVRNSYFHDNQMGILTGGKLDSDILIEGSEFARNTVNYEQTKSLGHNIYIGEVRSFTLRNSYVHGAAWGHNVKTRARENRVLYNRIEDGKDGSASYQVEIANGGRAWLVGNIIQQGRKADNWTMVTFGTTKRNPSDRIALVNNTLVNDRGSGIFLQKRSPGEATLINNILAGKGKPVDGKAVLQNNLLAKSVSVGIVGSLIGSNRAGPASGEFSGNFEASGAGFLDPEKLDFRLSSESPARNIGKEPGLVYRWPARPSAEYRHPQKQVPRPNDGKIDIGAFEFGKTR